MPISISRSCPICKSQKGRFKHYLFDNDNLIWNKKVSIYECRQCKCFFSMISSDEIPYDSNYYVFADYRKAADIAFAQHCWQWLLERTNVVKKKLLDVGSGRGYFCEMARHGGSAVIGLEPSRGVAEEAQRRGCPTIVGFFEEIDLGQNIYDILTMWDVLEHFNDPALCLGKANDLLMKRGLLAISVPNRSSLFAKIAGSYWKGYNPYHVSHFSIQGLVALLQKKGFRVISLDTHENNPFSREGLYRLGIKDRIKANMIKLPIGRKQIINRRGKMSGKKEIITGHDDYLDNTKRSILVELSVKLVECLRMGDQIRVLAEKI